MAHAPFKKRLDIHTWLRTLPSLDQKQRDAVEAVLMRYMDKAEISKDEFDYYLVKDLHALRDAGTITRFDHDALVSKLKALFTEGD